MNLAPTDPSAVRLAERRPFRRAGRAGAAARGAAELARARIAGRRPAAGARRCTSPPTGPGTSRTARPSCGCSSRPAPTPARRAPTGPSETPLHWAASSDDVDVAAALIDGGADIEAPGARSPAEARSPTRSATAAGTWRGCWSSGAPASMRCGRPPRSASSSGWWSSSAPIRRRPQEDLDEAFWQACHGGQLRMAELLLARGADIDAIPATASRRRSMSPAAWTRAEASWSAGCASAARRPPRGRRPSRTEAGRPERGRLGR